MTLASELKRLDEAMTPGPWEANPWYPREGGGGLSRYVESETRTVCQTAKGTDDVEGIAALRNLLPSLVALAEREAWQDIASAPRDGTLILLHGHDQINPGYYDATPRIGGYGPWHWGITFQPTHWMRLPEPPTPKE
jgi:hypothetical protein